MADDLPTDIQTPQRTPASKRGVGRPKGQSADKTRDAILNAAEDLFAANGFDGTSLRDVARASGVQIAAIGYHFGPKDALFDTVIQRRAEVMSDQRARDLDRLTAEHGTTPIPLADLVRAYVRPFIASASHGDPGWRTYAALMGRLANSPLGTEVIARHYDKTARAYLDAFQRALPNVPETRVIDGFTFMVASMLALCASTGRAERLSTEDHPPHDVGDTLNPLTAFLVAGFEALADTETTVTTQDDTR
ncbi:MAG: TetR/AcrR family transcriptional regulator [Pseudomonadota bacterium]